MKKIKKSLLLTAALFSLVACGATEGAANSSDSGYNSGANPAPEGEFDITYVADEAVTVNGPASAAKDARVSFTISYSSEVYVVESIKVNNELPSFEGNNSFAFVMPEGAVTVTVSGHYVDPTHGKFKVTNLNDWAGVVLDGADEYVKPGETVSFKVKFAYDSHFTFTGVVTATNDTTSGEVAITANADVYSFVMPNSNVTVDVDVEANKYQITIGSSEKSANFASSPFALQTGVEEYTALTGESFTAYYHGKDYTAYYASYGDSIRVKVKKESDKLIINGVKLSGPFSSVINVTELEAVPEEDYYYGYFTMPGYSVDVTATGTINYKSIAVENSDHFQATLKVKDGDDYVAIDNLDEIVPGTVVYVDISWIGEPDEDYGFDKITVDQVTSVTTDTAGERYHFTMPNKTGVKVTVFEKSYAQYKGYSFVGTHFGGEIEYTGSGRTLSSFSSSFDGYIQGDGSVKLKSNTGSITSIEDKGSFGLVNVVTGSTNRQVAYSGKFILGNWSHSSSSGYNNRFGRDFAVTVVAQDGDSRNNYKFYYQMNSDKSFLAVQAYRVVDSVETLYAVLIYDMVNNDIYSKDVTLEFTSGSYVNEASCEYLVKWNGTTVGSVTGATYTNLLPHPQSLTIVNSTHFVAAAYDGETPIADLTTIEAGSTVTVKLSDFDAGDGLVKDEDYEFGSLAFVDEAGTPVTVVVTPVTGGYTFTMPKADVTMTVIENDISLFKGYPFIGSYYGANLYGSSQHTSANMNNSYSLSCKGDGTLVKGVSSPSTFTVSSATSNSGDGLATLSSGKNFCYSDKFIFGHWGFTSDLANQFGQDYIVAIKKANSEDASSLYKFYYRIDSNKNYIAVQAYRNDVLYASMFFDALNKEFYGTDLVFEFASADGKVSTDASFTVKVGDTTIGTVTNGTYAKA